MGNSPSTSGSKRRKSGSRRDGESDMLGEIQETLQAGIKNLERNDHPAAQFLDSVCGPYINGEEESSDEETEYTEERRSRRSKKNGHRSYRHHDEDSYTSYDGTADIMALSSQKQSTAQPLASSFAKRCYFTKGGIGPTTAHYEGLTLTGNVILMLASAMKLKGCPTICDEDLRRVEQTYPNQFSRLPDELLLSSGWRRINKYCHFSRKPIPDGVPFFHSISRMHPSGTYYFLLASAVGMIRPIDVEPLNKDTLVLLETDFPQACDEAPPILVRDPDQWQLVDKFCFFSGGPINPLEDVYYQADLDGNPVYMLAFLSPNLTPTELYKLDGTSGALQTSKEVNQVETVYDLTPRDFEDLKLYHLGPCRALPQYILQPQSWIKILPPHFLAARQEALLKAQAYEREHGMADPIPDDEQGHRQPAYGYSQDEMDHDESVISHPMDEEPRKVATPLPALSELRLDPPDGGEEEEPPQTTKEPLSEMPDDELEVETFSPMSEDNSAFVTSMDTEEESEALPPRSPYETKPSSKQVSTAMRGAQELIRQNRIRRQQQVDSPQTPETDGADSDVVGGSSIVSGSSAWTDGSNPDKSARRQLILQMAKARMKNSAKDTAIPEEEEKKVMEDSSNIDLTQDLD